MLLLTEIISKVNQLPALDENLSVEWEGASAIEAIASVEKALGVEIRGTYRDFILATGGGGLDALYISPIPAKKPLEYGCYFDALYYREDWRSHKLPQHLVVIERDYESDNEPFCLDTSMVINGENPVVLFYHQSTGHSEKVANSFIEFYQDYLEPYFKEAGI
jgi:hypothetical protein